MADGVYGSDTNILDDDNDPEEYLALAGTLGFEAPEGVRANRITVDGTSLRYADAAYSGLLASGAVSFAALHGRAGSRVAVGGYAGGPEPTLLAVGAYGKVGRGAWRGRGWLYACI